MTTWLLLQRMQVKNFLKEVVQIFSSGRCDVRRQLDFTMIRWELHDMRACSSRIAKVPIQGLVIEEQVLLSKKVASVCRGW